MAPITVTEHSAAPVERVWELATDLQAAPDFLSAVIATEVTTSPPFGVGTRWTETRRIMKKDASEEMWVTAVDPNRSYVVEAESNGAHYFSTFTFEETADGGTDITLSFDAHPTGAISRLFVPVAGLLMRGSVAKQLSKDLEDLARAAEKG
jgi:uncharacterized protein YndB with AHSA1/START domain